MGYSIYVEITEAQFTLMQPFLLKHFVSESFSNKAPKYALKFNDDLGYALGKNPKIGFDYNSSIPIDQKTYIFYVICWVAIKLKSKYYSWDDEHIEIEENSLQNILIQDQAEPIKIVVEKLDKEYKLWIHQQNKQ